MKKELVSKNIFVLEMFFSHIFYHFISIIEWGSTLRDFDTSNDHTIVNSPNIFLPLRTSSAWLSHILKNINAQYHYSCLLTTGNHHELADNNRSVSTSLPSWSKAKKHPLHWRANIYTTSTILNIIKYSHSDLTRKP